MGVSNKSDFTSVKNGSIFPVMTWGEFRPDKNQTVMVNGLYTKQEEHLVNQVCNIKKIHQNARKSGY